MSATDFGQSPGNTLKDNVSVGRKIHINRTRNLKQDHTALLDQASKDFEYETCKHEYWNPEEFSLLWGTALWEQSSPSQRVLLNQLYWVAYYSQIISAEIATIYFNQTSAAGLYALEDFREVCDMLDLESAQERAHIASFKTVSDQVESSVFGKRIFSYPMRGPFQETMIFQDAGWFQRQWKALQLQAFGLISSSNAFLACQYFTVRGLRTLNGKLVQHKLSSFYRKLKDQENAPIPAKISHYHFMDESFHFNSSTILAHDVIDCLPPPTFWESGIANLGIRGCQIDHSQFSVAVNGIFWHDPALYDCIVAILTSEAFQMTPPEAEVMLNACFSQESDGLYASYKTHQEALASYRKYMEKVGYAWKQNKDMSLMSRVTPQTYLDTQRFALAQRTLS